MDFLHKIAKKINGLTEKREIKVTQFKNPAILQNSDNFAKIQTSKSRN